MLRIDRGGLGLVRIGHPPRRGLDQRRGRPHFQMVRILVPRYTDFFISNDLEPPLGVGTKVYTGICIGGGGGLDPAASVS